MSTVSFTLRLIAVTTGMILPLWGLTAWGWPDSFDFVFHATVIKIFSSQLWAGDSYPRWLVHANAGFGSPAFVFYGPALYYLMSLFEWLSSADPYGYARLLLSMNLALFTGGLTSYHWLSAIMPRAQAQKGALLYASFPFLLIALYFHFSLAQLWALAIFPLLLTAAGRVAVHGARGVPSLSLSYALLAVTHLMSLVLFFPVPLVYACCLSPSNKRFAHGLLAAIGALLGIALAAFYFFPALANKPYINHAFYVEEKYFYGNNFLNTYSWIGILLLIVPLLAFYRDMPPPLRRQALTRTVRMHLLIVTGLLFMVLPLSKPLWDHILLLQYLQEPARFFLGMIPSVVFITASWMPLVRNRVFYPAATLIGLVCATIGSAYAVFHSTAMPKPILDYNLLPTREYQTSWMLEQKLDFLHSVPDTYAHLPEIALTEGSGQVSIEHQTARRITLHADIQSPQATATLRRFYFPGWESTDQAVQIRPEKALLALRLPKGSHDIILSQCFEGEKEGLTVTAAAALCLLVWALFWYLRPGCNTRKTE